MTFTLFPRRVIGRLLCWCGLHAITRTVRLDEGRVWGLCGRCRANGVLDAQGQLP